MLTSVRKTVGVNFGACDTSLRGMSSHGANAKPPWIPALSVNIPKLHGAPTPYTGGWIPYCLTDGVESSAPCMWDLWVVISNERESGYEKGAGARLRTLCPSPADS